MLSKKGLTLVECLIALLVLTILLTVGMSLYFYSQESLQGAVNKRIAAEMASAELEYLKNSDYDVLDEAILDPDNKWPARSGTTNGIINIGNLTGHKDVFLYDIDADGNGTTDYKQVHVEVYWRDPAKNADSKISLDTYIVP